MLDVKKCLKLKNVAVFAGGVLFGTAGVKQKVRELEESKNGFFRYEVSAQKSAL